MRRFSSEKIFRKKRGVGQPLSYPLVHDGRKERIIMKLRNDSPFKNATREQMDFILEAYGNVELHKIVERLRLMKPPIICTVPALKRFARRLKEDALFEEVDEASETMEKFAANAKNGKVREGTLEAARQRLYTNVLETNDLESLQKFFRMMAEEKKQEQLLAIEDRKAKAAEENAKIGWRKLELSAAQSALKLLPQIREALMDASVSAEERVNRALRCLMEGGGKLLLGEGSKG
jgi:hypothetical protein